MVCCRPPRDVDDAREKADDVHKALTENLQAREEFLNAFPHVKKELEEGIAKLYALAENVDKVHKDCTIANVVASSSGASGILTIQGLALAPVTAGGSLLLSATGMGLGAAAAVTGVSATIVDHSNKSSAQAEASRMLSSGVDTASVLQAMGETTPKVASAAKKCAQAFQAFKEAKSNARLLASANRLTRSGKISVQSGKLVQKVFGGTVPAMSKGIQAMGAATGVFFLMDMYSLVQDSVHLHKGAKTESSVELRQQAQVLEKKLEELIEIHESLQ
ncbi:LOW QUALITY PROTEIN: apolipoprotein L3-like [Erethizon dorsatum]